MISYDCAAELNEIINHPGVIEGHLVNGQKPPLDVSPVLERGGFGCLGEGYGFLMDNIAPGVYEVHTSILPEYRKRSIDITLEAMAEGFTQTAVMEIVTRIKDNKPARILAKSVGMLKTFERNGYEFFSIHISHWAAKADQFKDLGEQFHQLLELEGIETNHEHDENHNQYVGIALAMATAGLYDKAIWFYNVWAKLAGFYPAEQVDDNKAFIGNVIVEFLDGEMRIVKCQQ